MCFLVNIELGRAPKKMLIFFQKGKGGERGKGWGDKKNMQFIIYYGSLIGVLKKFQIFSNKI